jgi:hypothetical protein
VQQNQGVQGTEQLLPEQPNLLVSRCQRFDVLRSASFNQPAGLKALHTVAEWIENFLCVHRMIATSCYD